MGERPARPKPRPFLLGLTGSIGMGKSTTAGLFAAAGVPVWDADATVHALYEQGGAAVAPIAERFPDAVVEGAVDRAALRRIIAADPGAIGEIEAIVHPLTAASRATFVADHADARLLLLDIPLLFETGAEHDVHAVVVVTAPPEVQRVRVLARLGMTEDAFALILSRQLPDAEKRARATYVIETLSIAEARAAVQSIIAELTTDQEKDIGHA